MSIVHVPFYPSDWLAGTRGLSAEETGVYITLVARIYEMAGPIERDDNRLARLCGCGSKAKFVKALEYLISEGKIVEREGRITNERAEKEIKNVTGKSEKAKAAAQSRWDKKDNKNNGSDNADASLGHMPEGCQPKPKPNIEKDISNDISKKTPSASVVLKPKSDRQIFVEALVPILGDELANDIAKHRTKLKAPNTPRAATGLVNRLQKCPDPVLAANEMILRGWKSVEPEWLERSGASSPSQNRGPSSFADAAVANRASRAGRTAPNLTLVPDPWADQLGKSAE